MTKSDLKIGCFSNSFATYHLFCLPWLINSLNDTAITVFATASDFDFFPCSPMFTSIFVLATFNAFARIAVFCLNSRILNKSATANSNDCRTAQSHSSGKQLSGTTLLNSRCRKSHICPGRKKSGHTSAYWTFWTPHNSLEL